MGLFSRRRDTANLPQDPAATPGRADTLPAGTMMGRMKANGTAAWSQASAFTRQHPKLLGSIALLGAAALLNRMKRPHAR